VPFKCDMALFHVGGSSIIRSKRGLGEGEEQGPNGIRTCAVNTAGLVVERTQTRLVFGSRLGQAPL
jgi:hypothetical protein